MIETVSHNGLDTEVYDLRPADYTITTTTTTTIYCNGQRTGYGQCAATGRDPLQRTATDHNLNPNHS